MRTVNPSDWSKGLSSEFPEGYQVRQKAPEEDWSVEQPKRHEYSNKVRIAVRNV